MTPSSFARAFVSVADAEARAIDAAWSAPEAVPARTVLHVPGRTCRTLFFLDAGYARFYAEPGGRDVTRHFVSPGKPVTVYPSFESGVASCEGIETLTEARVRRLSREASERLEAEAPAWAAFRRAFVRDLYAYLDRTLDSARTLTAAERYDAFEAEYPGVLLHVPLSAVASYLGMTPQSLSRVRARRFLPNAKAEAGRALRG